MNLLVADSNPAYTSLSCTLYQFFSTKLHKRQNQLPALSVFRHTGGADSGYSLLFSFESMTKVADLVIFHEFVHFSYNMNFLAEYGTIFQFSRFFHGSK